MNKKEVLADIKNNLGVNLSSENITEYYDIVYSYMMTKYGETSTETELIINDLFN